MFVHEIDPSAGDAVEQAKLNAIHAGISKEEVDAAIREALSKLINQLPKLHRFDPSSTKITC